MFLFERLVGVGTYAALLVFICLYMKNKPTKQLKGILLAYSIMLSILAFFYVPYESADLYRIYGFVENFQKYSFAEFYRTQVENSNISLVNMLYWAIGKTGIKQLLPALVTFVCYSCVFYIIRRTAEKNQISSKNVAIALFFYMSTGNYMFVVAGIRCMLGISLLCFCFFRESVEKKFSLFHIPLYVIAAFIHTFSAVLIAARFVVAIFDSRTSPAGKLVYCVSLGLGGLLAFYNLDSYITQILDKADSYLTGEHYSYFWEYAIAVIVSLVILSALFKRRLILKDSEIKLSIWCMYAIILLIIAVFLCWEFTIFHRLTTYIVPIIALPILMTFLEKNDTICRISREKLRGARISIRNASSDILILSVLMLFVACSRGSLSSLKFFEL